MSVYYYDWNALLNEFIHLQQRQRNGVVSITPFYNRKPRCKLTTVQKIIVYRFIKNYQNAT